MKELTIIGGVNGVGKSSIYGVLKGDRESVDSKKNFGIIIDTDKITAQLGGDKLRGGREAVRLINDCLKKGESFTWETTLSGQKTLKTILAAREKGYKIILHYIAVGSAEESLSRIKNRVCKGGHDIPEEDVRRRFEKRFDDLLKVLPYCDKAIFWDNENGFVRAASYLDQELKLDNTERLPEWILSLKRLCGGGMIMNNGYSLKMSGRYFNAIEGELFSPLFGRKVRFLAKNCDEIYAARCAEYFESIDEAAVRSRSELSALAEGAAAYILELIEENEFELDGFEFGEDTPSEEIFRSLSPLSLIFSRHPLLDDEDCPIAFALKMSFDPVPDEGVEIAVHGDVPVYAGEFRGADPWDDRLLKKSGNYLKKR